VSATVIQNSGSAHVTLRVGQVVAQFNINRDGPVFPAYLYDNNGYGSGHLVHNLESFPPALLPEVTQLVRKYQTLFLLVGSRG
jgi:hypothetical protein